MTDCPRYPGVLLSTNDLKNCCVTGHNQLNCFGDCCKVSFLMSMPESNMVHCCLWYNCNNSQWHVKLLNNMFSTPTCVTLKISGDEQERF